jgi:hypothetical protein
MYIFGCFLEIHFNGTANMSFIGVVFLGGSLLVVVSEAVEHKIKKERRRKKKNKFVTK